MQLIAHYLEQKGFVNLLQKFINVIRKYNTIHIFFLPYKSYIALTGFDINIECPRILSNISYSIKYIPTNPFGSIYIMRKLT